MENDEKNFQNGVNDFEQNTNVFIRDERMNEDNDNNMDNAKTNGYGMNQNGKKQQKNGKNKMIVLIVIVLILLLVVGVIVGVIISGKGTTIINQTEEKSNVEAKEEEKTSKKIDESKDWVYDAEYVKDKENKVVDGHYNSNKELVVPYININSKDAEEANKQIEAIFEEIYSKYGEKNSEKVRILYQSKYEWYENENILSVVINVVDSVVNGGAGTSKLYIYNFNLDTLNNATLDEMSKVCGFKSSKDVTSKIAQWEDRQRNYEKNNPDMIAAQLEKVANNQYFIDADGNLNFVYIGLAAGRYYTPCVVVPNKEIEDFYEISENNNTKIEEKDSKEKTEENNDQKNQANNTTAQKGINKIYLSDANLIYAVSELNDFTNGMKLSTNEYMSVAYNMINDGKIKIENDSDEIGVLGVPEDEINSIIYTIFGIKLNEHDSVGSVLKYENGQYILEKSDRGIFPIIRNIKTDIAAGTRYIIYDMYTEDYAGKESYRGRYQLAVSNADGYVISKKAIPHDEIVGSKVVNKLSPFGWAGSSMQEIRLYDNGDVYHVTYNGDGNTEANIISFDLIAKNVDSIEEKVNGQVFESIVIKGKNVNKVRNNVESWIIFENN